MSSSNPPSNNFEEDPTKDEHPEDGCSPSGQGRKLTPLPLSNPGAKPGQNQVSSFGRLGSIYSEEFSRNNGLTHGFISFFFYFSRLLFINCQRL